MSDFNPDEYQIQTLLLKAPMIKDMSSSLVSCVKDALVGYIFDLGDPESDISEDYYYNFVRGIFYDEQDEPRVFANSQEWFNFVQNEDQTFKNALYEVGVAANGILELNRTAINCLFNVISKDVYTIPFREAEQDAVMIVIVSRK